MKVATKHVRTRTDFECGDARIQIDSAGDLHIACSGGEMWALGATEVEETTAVLRAYLAHIDGVAATEPADDGPPRVGDWVEVLMDYPLGAGVHAGEHYPVKYANDRSIYVPNDNRNDGTWALPIYSVRVIRRKNGGDA